ncbi:acetate--CoA ligase family protein [Candidatus Bipolaricaulota bacterium]|nr:acetate--CoA ligase family protein [Candidatus Bipolaricaulota bacterium]
MHSMRTHDDQAKQLFAEYGIQIMPSPSVATVHAAVSATKAFGFPVVIKAQIHGGGRSKRGHGDLVETAKSAPNVIVREWVGPVVGSRPFQAFRFGNPFGLPTAKVATNER